MPKTDSDVGTGLVGAPACGDVMKLQIRVDPANQTISDVKFKTFGCGSAIASSSYLTELVRGMTLEKAGKIRNTEIAKELCLPPVKCEYFGISFLGKLLQDGQRSTNANSDQYIAPCSPKTQSNPPSRITTPRTLKPPLLTFRRPPPRHSRKPRLNPIPSSLQRPRLCLGHLMNAKRELGKGISKLAEQLERVYFLFPEFT